MSDGTSENPRTHKVFKTLTFDLKSSAFTSPVEPSSNSPTTSTYNLPTIAGDKSLPRALQPKTSHHGVSVGYKPIFTGYGAVSKNSEDCQIPRRSSVTCTFKSQCSLSRPPTVKESASPVKHRNSIQVAETSEPIKSKIFSSETIHVSKRSGVDNGSIFLSLGDALKKRIPEEELKKSEDDVMRNVGRNSKISPGGKADSLNDNSTISKAYISLQKSGRDRKNNSSIDSTSLDLSWSTSYGRQNVDGPYEGLPGTIHLTINPQDGRNEKLKKENILNDNKETEPSPIEVVTIKRHQVSIVKNSSENHKISQPCPKSAHKDEIQDEIMKPSREVTPFDRKIEVSREINKKSIKQTLQTSANQDLNKQDQGTVNQSNDKIINYDDDVIKCVLNNESADNDVKQINDDEYVEEPDFAVDKSELCFGESIKNDDNAELVGDDNDDDLDDKANDNNNNDIDDDIVGINADNVDNKITNDDKDCFNNIDDKINTSYDDDVDETIGHDNDVPPLPSSIPPSFKHNKQETIEAERTALIKETFEPVDQSTVKSTHLVVEEVIKDSNFDGFKSAKFHLSGSDEDDDDDSGCEESLTNENTLFIDEGIEQQTNKNNNKTANNNELNKLSQQITETHDEDSFNLKTEKGLKALRKKCQEVRDENSKVRGDTTFVKFQKGYLGVGFCIEGGRGSPVGDRPIFIKRVVRNDVPLTPGDELISINGEEVMTMTCGQVWSFLKSIPDGEMVLELKKKE